ncbi:hypothetical protein OIDMADRAFT_148537 [Oidiodendron maius Zn]|uniref:Uncharacterized protein n=1 Tax=Oidiodendron maius (strain Zn) TaxID=913774 RepID=A0A0C3H0I5_OIDMZ|nr:hypothetical protein OIDMADRAFT_148537 [Oidiodendron maius Zn]
MFDLPDAKQVRREDLSIRSGSTTPRSSPDPETEKRYLERLGRVYGVSEVGRKADEDDIAEGHSSRLNPTQYEHDFDEKDNEGEAAAEEEDFAFRLFASEPARQIVIREEDAGTGAFVGTRDPRVFILGRAEGERKRGFESVAISGEEVLRRKGMRAWGLEVPWRVLVVRNGSSMKGTKGSGTSGEDWKVRDIKGKKKRAGKKRRILIRVRKRKGEEEKERKRREEAERGEREREKRTKKNREKKVKRKMKEKAKKAGNGEGATVADQTLATVGKQGD